MKLATIRSAGRTVAARVDGDDAIEIGAPDVGSVLRRLDWRAWSAAQNGPHHSVESVDFAPVVPNPDKIICVGLNYRTHILEMGRELPEYPTLFAKFRQTLLGANDDILLPAVSDQVDWEAELALIVGARARHVSETDARDVIAGYAVLNDVSVRDYQSRTLQWLQGKTFDATTPVGPFLVTIDEATEAGREITCEVAGELMQKGDTADLVFSPAALVSYISAIVTLEPGDIIATGTPGGVGIARTPPRYLADGETVVTRIAGLGELRNTCRKERLPQ
jgi:acylpyruvate hydrolase